MPKSSKSASFDADAFYERLFGFGQRSQRLVSKLPTTDYNKVYGVQLIRSSSSPSSNYIEALEAAGRKDFMHRLRICRKEIRESINWLRFIKEANPSLMEVTDEAAGLIKEGRELVKILTSSIITSEKKKS